MINNNSIGVFDSGIGGLTVVKSIIEQMPHENIIYFGDIARIPYGTKSIETIQKFTKQTVQFLLKQNVKAIVIACNTISAVAKNIVIELAGSSIPVIDVISAGSQASVNQAKKVIGIIATPVTIKSKAYETIINSYTKKFQVISQACPLFVPLIEEGLIEHPALNLIAHDYLNELIKYKVDTLVLGCTHYPLIHDTIQQIMGNNTSIINPADEVSNNLYNILKTNYLLRDNFNLATYKFYVTELGKLKEIGEKFLNHPMRFIELVNLE